MEAQYFEYYPIAIYNHRKKALTGNKHFEGIFKENIDKTKIIFLAQAQLDIEESAARTIWIEKTEYLLFFTPLKTGDDLMVIAFETKCLEPALKEMDAVKCMDRNYRDILESIYDDLVIIDKNGVIEQVMPHFETMYGISAEEAVGSTVKKMEELRIFNPSVALIVMKTLKQETMLQFTGADKYLICTAIPIFDEDGNIKQIVSYSRDVTKYEKLREEYEKLNEMLELNNIQLEQYKKERKAARKIVSTSPAMAKVFSIIEKVSDFDATILFQGESGVGKTMFAEIIHEHSPRKNNPFISINCGAIPEHLLESELFGYEKGAFTGASVQGKAGRIELAHGGTLFLDEIADIPAHMQVKLLEVIQSKRMIRIGGVKKKSIDFRLIAATNKDLEKLVEAGLFREDLFYRLNVIPIHIPPLRDRREDIFPLINIFLRKFCKTYKVEHSISSNVIDALEMHDWPGNIRELENLIERMVLISDAYMIEEDILPASVKKSFFPAMRTIEGKSLKCIWEELERKIILECYHKYGTTTKVAQVLGISQSSASIKINKYLKED